MAIPHALPNEPVDVRPFGDGLAEQVTRSLFKSEQLEAVRLVMPAGKVIAEHSAPGEITVHCLEGRVAFTAEGATHELGAGELLYLKARQPHSLKAIEDASVLVTLVVSGKR